MPHRASIFHSSRVRADFLLRVCVGVCEWAETEALCGTEPLTAKTGLNPITPAPPARNGFRMFPEIELTEECRRVLGECELLSAAWGLSVCVRDSREVPAVRMAECSGLFTPSADASRFGVPAGCGLAAVDVQQLLPLSDPIGRVVSVAAHEMAHGVQDALESICFGDAIETPEDFEPTIWTPGRLQEVGRPPWSGHGPEFLRAAAHVAFRMWEAGLPVSLAWIVNHEAYGLSPFSWYFSELLEECKRRAGVPIVAALQTEAPAGFRALWREDVERAATKILPSGSSRHLASSCHYSEEPSSKES